MTDGLGAHGQARPRLEALSPDDREALGRLVREVWVACAREHPAPKPSWLAPWEELGEWDKETDRRIGASLALHGAATAAARMHELHVKEIAAAEAKLAAIEAHTPAIVDALRHALSYVEHVPHPSSQAAAGRYRSALVVIHGEEES